MSEEESKKVGAGRGGGEFVERALIREKKDGGEERDWGLHCKKWFCFNIQEGPQTLDMNWMTGEDHSFPVQWLSSSNMDGWTWSWMQALHDAAVIGLKWWIFFLLFKANSYIICKQTKPDNMVLMFMTNKLWLYQDVPSATNDWALLHECKLKLFCLLFHHHHRCCKTLTRLFSLSMSISFTSSLI